MENPDLSDVSNTTTDETNTNPTTANGLIFDIGCELCAASFEWYNLLRRVKKDN